MNVNRVQHTPYFTSLFIKKGPDTKTKLNELSLEASNKLVEAAKLLGKDGDEGATKFYHVVVGENLDCSIVAEPYAYFESFDNKEYKTSYGKEKEDGKDVVNTDIIMIQDKNGKSIAGVTRSGEYIDGKTAFRVWGIGGTPYNSLGDIGILAKLAKILDGVAAEKYAEQAKRNKAEEAERKAVAQNTDQLLEHYSE